MRISEFVFVTHLGVCQAGGISCRELGLKQPWPHSLDMSCGGLAGWGQVLRLRPYEREATGGFLQGSLGFSSVFRGWCEGREAEGGCGTFPASLGRRHPPRLIKGLLFLSVPKFPQTASLKDVQT